MSHVRKHLEATTKELAKIPMERGGWRGKVYKTVTGIGLIGLAWFIRRVGFEVWGWLDDVLLVVGGFLIAGEWVRIAASTFKAAAKDVGEGIASIKQSLTK